MADHMNIQSFQCHAVHPRIFCQKPRPGGGPGGPLVGVWGRRGRWSGAWGFEVGVGVGLLPPPPPPPPQPASSAASVSVMPIRPSPPGVPVSCLSQSVSLCVNVNGMLLYYKPNRAKAQEVFKRLRQRINRPNNQCKQGQRQKQTAAGSALGHNFRPLILRGQCGGRGLWQQDMDGLWDHFHRQRACPASHLAVELHRLRADGW